MSTGSEFLSGPCRNPRGACIGFKVSASATPCAQASVGTRVDDHVTTFSAETVLSYDQFVVDDDPSSDTGTKGQKHHAVVDLSGSDPEFTEGCRVGVVGVGDRHFQGVFQALDDWEVMPMRVIGWLEQKSLADVLAAGGSKPCSQDLFFAQSATVKDFFTSDVYTSHGIFGALRLECLDSDEVQRGSLVIGQPDFDSRASNVDSQEQGHFGMRNRRDLLVGHEDRALGYR